MKPYESDHNCIAHVSEAAIDVTVRYWEGRTGRRLTREEARESVENILGLARLLDELKANEASFDETEHHE
ncbi:MAG: hypothetical protein M5R41_19270 [Bacteroidia bacterium]|nr:hypothetical protein [Bacteroidia bacterium]